MLHSLDVVIILVFIAQAIRTGLKSRKIASENLEQYFLAGRTLPGWKAGISMAATQFAADTPLLVTGLVATAGLFSLWRLWSYAFAFLLLGFLLSRSWRRVGVITDAELTEVRYSEKSALVLRMIKSLYFGTVFNCTVMAMVLLAATRIAEPFLMWNEWLPTWAYTPMLNLATTINVPITYQIDSNIVWILTTNNLLSLGAIMLVTIFYSSTGGLRSVVNTDVLQFFIMMGATLLYAISIIRTNGGPGAMMDKIQNLYATTDFNMNPEQLLAMTPDQAFNISASLITVFAFQWLIQMNSDGTGYLAQRTMACRSEKDAKVAAIIFSFLQILLRSIFWIAIALGLIVIFPQNPESGITAFREASFIEGVNLLLPPGVKGLMLTGMLAALASTIDTHLNWGSSYWSNDLYGRLYCEIYKKKTPNPKTLVWVARLSNIGILTLALTIMFHLESIQTAWKASLIIGGSMGIPLLLRWLWWRMNSWGEIAAIIASIITAPILIGHSDNLSDAQKLLTMAGISTVSCLSAIFLFGPEKKQTLRNFYHRARPLGFWGPLDKEFEVSKKDQRKKFFYSIMASIVCCLSLFTLLIGLATLLFNATAPYYFPWSQKIWGWLNIFIGVSFIPLWYKWGGLKNASFSEQIPDSLGANSKV